MSTAGRFLSAMGYALDLRQRGGVDAATRRAADDVCATRAAELLFEHPKPSFRFTEGEVRYGALPLAGFEQWPWARRLAERGVAWLEIVEPPTTASVAAFLDLAAGLVPAGAQVPRDGLRWTPVGIELPADNDDYPLDEELAVMRQLFASAERGEPLRLGDVMAVLASLTLTVQGEQGPRLPLLHVGSREDYQPAHGLNTAVLTLAVAEALGLGAEERREAGLAAMLHDIGMARIPPESSAGERFTQQDRALVRGHPQEGARLLLRNSDALESAAVVSYEHHLRQDGTGYPRLSYPREPHLLSKVVAVCDAFDALLAPRPDRPGYEPVAALREIERSAVSQFDARVVGAFSDVVLRAAPRGSLTLTLRQN